MRLFLLILVVELLTFFSGCASYTINPPPIKVEIAIGQADTAMANDSVVLRKDTAMALDLAECEEETENSNHIVFKINNDALIKQVVSQDRLIDMCMRMRGYSP